jgi:hypothetical protein
MPPGLSSLGYFSDRVLPFAQASLRL